MKTKKTTWIFILIKEGYQNKVNELTIEELNNTRRPTVENPFMNINLITDNKTLNAAPPSWNNEDLQKEIDEKFNYDLYRDVGDLYGKNNSQRQFFSVPQSTIGGTGTNDKYTSFVKWCWNTGPTAKEKSIYGAPQMAAVPAALDTSNTTTFTNVKY